MKELTYTAVFEPSKDGGFGVYFPDVEGCVTCGDSFEHAHAMAAEALALHLCDMEEYPPVSPEPYILPETTAGYFLSPVTVSPASGDFDGMAGAWVVSGQLLA